MCTGGGPTFLTLAWIDACRYRRSLKQRIIAGKHRIAVMRQCFLPWLDYANASAQRHRAIQRFRARQTAQFVWKLMAVWRHWTRKMILEHAAATRAIVYTRAHETRRALRRWRAVFVRKSQERHRRSTILAYVPSDRELSHS